MLKKLKIACLVKIVPDVDCFAYDDKKNALVRENKKSIVNPEDSCAVAAALELQSKLNAEVLVVSMGPKNTQKNLENLVRCGVNQVVLITDTCYSGSDTYVTSKILGKYLKNCEFDLILAGTHSIDGDTAHIPCQIAELLDVNVMSGVIKIHDEKLVDGQVQFEVNNEGKKMIFSIKMPAVLGISSESKYKLPYIRYEDLKKDVTDAIRLVTNEELGFYAGEVGVRGSKTKVVHTYPKKLFKKDKVVLSNDEKGIEYVYQFLKEKGFL